MIKVAIDTEPLFSGHAVRGVGVNTKLLIEYLQKISEVKIETVDFSTTNLSSYDIAHYQAFNPFFVNLPVVKKTKIVVTVHDLIPLIYPKHYPPGIKGSVNFFINKLLIKNADAIITISETSKKDIVRFLGVDPLKIHVIYLAPKPIFKKITSKKILSQVRQKYSLPEKFVLYVGDVNYNKNIPGLVRACDLVGIPLVMVGKNALNIENKDLSHPELSHLKEIVKALTNSRKVVRLGFVDDNDIVALYNLATVYCQPSFYEGFGLPVLEALSCEIPVVASRIQAHVEIAEKGVLFANPKDPQDLASKIKMFSENKDVRKKYVTLAKSTAEKYSWEKTARQTCDLYKKLLG